MKKYLLGLLVLVLMPLGVYAADQIKVCIQNTSGWSLRFCSQVIESKASISKRYSGHETYTYYKCGNCAGILAKGRWGAYTLPGYEGNLCRRGKLPSKFRAFYDGDLDLFLRGAVTNTGYLSFVGNRLSTDPNDFARCCKVAQGDKSDFCKLN